MEKKLKLGHGNWVAGDQFWDREYEIERLTELLDEGAHVVLVAPRRIGKTSLMHEVARRIGGRYTCLHVDLQKSLCPADAVVELSVATHPHRRLWEKTSEMFRNILCSAKNAIDSLQINELTITLRSSLTSGNWRDKGDTLLGNLANSDQPVVIFFDEVAILVNRMLKGSDYKMTPEKIRDVDAFMSWLRENSIRHKGKLRMVLAGSIGIGTVLRQANLSATLNTFSSFELPPWRAETAVQCLHALANQYGIRFQEGACENIVGKLGCCIPHHVQTFFDAVYTDCRLQKRTLVSGELVDEVYQTRMLGVRGHAELSHLEERLKMVLGEELYPLALELLTETAVAGELTVEAAAFLSEQYPVDGQNPVSVLRQILEFLEHDGYLRKANAKHRFISNLLRDWWKARFESFYTPVSERRG